MRKALATVLATASLLPSVAMAEPFVLARDSKSGIEIYALPDEKSWCQQQVKLQFVTGSPELYSEHKASILVRKLGKIFKKQCPQSQQIQVTAFNKNNGQVLTFANAFAPSWQLQAVQTAQANTQPKHSGSASVVTSSSQPSSSPIAQPPTVQTPVAPVLPKLTAKEVRDRVIRDNMRLDLMDAKLELIEYKVKQYLEDKAKQPLVQPIPKADINNSPRQTSKAQPIKPALSTGYSIRTDGAVVDLKAEQAAKQNAANEQRRASSFPKEVASLGLSRTNVEASIKHFFDTESNMAKKYSMDRINQANYQVISANQVVAHIDFKYKDKATSKEHCCEKKAFIIYKMPKGFRAIAMTDSDGKSLTKQFSHYQNKTILDGVWEARTSNASYILTIQNGKSEFKLSDGRSPFVFKADTPFNNEVIYGDGKRSYLVDIQGSLYQVFRDNDMIRNNRMTPILTCYGCRSTQLPDTWWLKYRL